MVFFNSHTCFFTIWKGTKINRFANKKWIEQIINYLKNIESELCPAIKQKTFKELKEAKKKNELIEEKRLEEIEKVNLEDKVDSGYGYFVKKKYLKYAKKYGYDGIDIDFDKLSK